jgi:acetyltransferase-like isoleucine patch superfamily enzyme
MNKIKKVWYVFERKAIGLLNYVSPKYYMPLYYRYLKKIGVCFVGGGRPNYIDPSVHFDGVDYSLITLGTNDVISKDVLFLTHDYSIFRALKYVDRENDGERILKPISVGNNVFIGVRSTILPGTTIEDNVIIGACSVVKGRVRNGTIVAGNPAHEIKRMEDYAEQWLRANGKL